MKIGIDISQLAYEGTGVSYFLKNWIESLLKLDKKNEYILFFSSLRKTLPELSIENNRARIKKFRFPPSLLNLVWNKLHILPIENLIGKVDIFITSDWTEPPAKAPKATIIYDLVIEKYPRETDKKIIEVQKRKLDWVRKESKIVFCISEATKKDAAEILGIDTRRIRVIYPGA